MGTNSALDSVMDRASQAAEAFDGDTNQGTALTTAQTTAVTQNRRPSLDDMADNAGIQVDTYLAVKEAGFRIDKGEYFKKFKGRIDLTECAPITSVRANRGGQTVFIKSYDGVSTSQGQNFAQATAQLHAQYDKVDGPYATVEIPVTLLQDVPGLKKGQRLGITPSITGAKFFTKFYNELRNLNLSRATVDVEIEAVPQANNKGNDWSVASFSLIGEAK